MATDNRYTNLLSRNVKGILLSLCVQFILGMAVNLYAVAPDDPKFGAESPLIKASFIAHGINGLILPLFALTILFFAFKSGNARFKKIAGVGLLSILVAAIAGISTITLKDNAIELASFVMSIGFLLSFVSYGKLFLLIKSGE